MDIQNQNTAPANKAASITRETVGLAANNQPRSEKIAPASLSRSHGKRWHGWSFFVARIALATLFIVAGVDGFMEFIPHRAFPSEGQTAFNALIQQKPLWFTLNILQIVAGSLLFFGIFDVMAIFLLGPIVIGVLIFHAAFDQAGIPFAVFLVLLFAFTAWNLREDPRSLFKLNFDDGIKDQWRRSRGASSAKRARALKARTH